MSWVREDYMGWGLGGLLVVDLCWGGGGNDSSPCMGFGPHQAAVLPVL